MNTSQIFEEEVLKSNIPMVNIKEINPEYLDKICKKEKLMPLSIEIKKIIYGYRFILYTAQYIKQYSKHLDSVKDAYCLKNTKVIFYKDFSSLCDLKEYLINLQCDIVFCVPIEMSARILLEYLEDKDLQCYKKLGFDYTIQELKTQLIYNNPEIYLNSEFYISDYS